MLAFVDLVAQVTAGFSCLVGCVFLTFAGVGCALLLLFGFVYLLILWFACLGLMF